MTRTETGGTMIGEGATSEEDWALLAETSQFIITSINRAPAPMRMSIVATMLVSLCMAQDDPDSTLNVIIETSRIGLEDAIKQDGGQL